MTSPAAHGVLQLTARGIEGVTLSQAKIVVDNALAGSAFDHDFAPWYGDGDAEIEQLALVVAARLFLDRDAANGNAGMIAAKPLGMASEPVGHGRRAVHVAEENFDRESHQAVPK